MVVGDCRDRWGWKSGAAGASEVEVRAEGMGGDGVIFYLHAVLQSQ
jgi:hypothetical protein